MDKQSWRKSDQPQAMLKHLEEEAVRERYSMSKGSEPVRERKLRLFACALYRCCYDGPEAQRLTGATERWADGEANREDVLAEGAEDNWVVIDYEAGEAARQAVEHYAPGARRPGAATLLREIVGNPFKPAHVVERSKEGWLWKKDGSRVSIGEIGKVLLLDRDWLTPQALSIATAACEERTQRICEMCNGIGGKARHPERRDARLFRCRHCDGRGQGADGHGHLDPLRVAVLADALEEAGCTEQELLRHLRGEELCPTCMGSGLLEVTVGLKLGEAGAARETKHAAPCQTCMGDGWIKLRGPHVRGCWATDLVLGKS